MQIKLIRHSERLDFTYPFYWLFCFGQYWADSPLTSNGHLHAKEKGKQISLDQFNPKYIYTSPYKRTITTSTEIKSSFPYSEIIIEPLLAEYQPNFRHRIDLYPTGIPTDYDGKNSGFDFPESFENFSKRIQFIISKLIEKNDQDILIVTHGEVLKVFINHLQTQFPEIFLDPGNTPYLTILSFNYDKENKKIIADSIKIN